MRLTIVGSSSAGNSYILHNSQEALIIEAGCAISEILKVLDYNVSKVAACIVSHEHKDHSKNVFGLQKYGVKCYMSRGTNDGLSKKYFEPKIIRAFEEFQVGNFRILPFDTHHDSNEPLSFLIHHDETGWVLFAIDTCYLEYTFENLSNIMIECNYSEDILERNINSGVVHKCVGRHVLKSHMSLQTCLSTLSANDLSKVNNIVLLHLSKDNSDPERFFKEVSSSTGKMTYIATKGLEIDFNKERYSTND